MIELILGGARSGKSAYAESIALASDDRRVIYAATAELREGDDEFAARVAIHRSRRPSSWGNWECGPDDLAEKLSHERGSMILVDCLTMLLTRKFFATRASEDGGEDEWKSAESAILYDVAKILHSVHSSVHMLLVSNEVGMGIVPETRLSRRFRDMQGRANRLAACAADRVVLIVAGLPLVVKG